MSVVEIWTYRDSSHVSSDLVGYGVEAIDGHIGKVDQASNEVDLNYIVVDTGPWIFGKKVLLPAGVIASVDKENETVQVNRTKDQIKASPELRPETYNDEEYRSEIGTYYGPGGLGWQD
jgi:hypothetical protein